MAASHLRSPGSSNERCAVSVPIVESFAFTAVTPLWLHQFARLWVPSAASLSACALHHAARTFIIEPVRHLASGLIVACEPLSSGLQNGDEAHVCNFWSSGEAMLDRQLQVLGEGTRPYTQTGDRSLREATPVNSINSYERAIELLKRIDSVTTEYLAGSFPVEEKSRHFPDSPHCKTLCSNSAGTPPLQTATLRFASRRSVSFLTTA